MAASAVAPMLEASTGTSRHPRTRIPSSAHIFSTPSTASRAARASVGQKADARPRSYRVRGARSPRPHEGTHLAPGRGSRRRRRCWAPPRSLRGGRGCTATSAIWPRARGCGVRACRPRTRRHRSRAPVLDGTGRRRPGRLAWMCLGSFSGPLRGAPQRGASIGVFRLRCRPLRCGWPERVSMSRFGAALVPPHLVRNAPSLERCRRGDAPSLGPAAS